jgi:hypothetical protein
MLLHILAYLPFLGFIYMGLSRWYKYGDKKDFWPVIVGVVSIVILLINHFGLLFLTLSPSQLVTFYKTFQFIDVLIGIAVALLVIWEWMRK